MKIIALSALLVILLLAGSTTCGDFQPGPVYEHIKEHGAGIDVLYRAEHKGKNPQLKKKKFKSKGR